MAAFESSRIRVQRAYAHYQAFIHEWDSLFDKDTSSSIIRRDKKTGWFIVSAQLSPETIERIETNQLAIILGEFVYQLRAALDSLIWDAVTLTSGSEPAPDAKGLSRLEFPMSPTWKATDTDHGRFHGFPFPQRLIDWMRTIQPGAPIKPIDDPDRGLGTTLEEVHNLARLDRHRRLRVVGAVPLDTRVKVETLPEGGTITDHEWLDCNLLVGKYDYVRIKVVCPGDLMPYKMHVSTNVTFEISAEDVEIYQGEDLAGQFARFVQAVGHVISRFEEEYA